MSRKREIFGWAMYDFANSAYTTVIITVVFAVVFPKLIVGDAPDYKLGNLLWSVTLAAANLLAVLVLPVLGTLLDRATSKKRYLLGITVFTVASTAALGLASPGNIVLAMALVIASNLGFSVGESFIASFLPDLGTPEQLGRISGMAWGLGYMGGLTSTAVVLLGLGPLTLENFETLRWIGPITAAWFALASIPTFLLLTDRPGGSTAAVGGWAEGLTKLRNTWSDLALFPDLRQFFLSYFFAMGGLSIVISFAFIYGDQVVGWSTGGQQAAFVLTQLTATGGALAFGWLQTRLGDKQTFALTLVIWILAVFLIFATRPITALLHAQGVTLTMEQLFIGIGGVAGLCLGATQSAGRTMVALFAPSDRAGEFFGLWGVFGKLAAVVGMLAIGGLQLALGLENAVLVTGLFFVASLITLRGVDVGRGRNAAR